MANPERDGHSAPQYAIGGVEIFDYQEIRSDDRTAS